MALQIENITAEADQTHIIIADGIEVSLRLYFLSAVESWFMDCSYAGVSAAGIRLSAGAYHVLSYNLPFDFLVEITDRTGIDPFRADDFSSGRCLLWYVQRSEMLEIRGVEVPL